VQTQEQQIIDSEKNNIMTQIGQVLSIIESTLYEEDLLLGITTSNANKNDLFEIYLSAKNSSLKDTAKTQWYAVNTSYTIFKDKWKIFRE
jgi:Trm5-related predicted tRNA methylase